MRKGAKWAAVIGLLLGTGAIVWLGAGHIFQAILRVGWMGLAYVVAWQLFVFVLLGLSWWIVCPDRPAWVWIWGRLVRDGGGTCLPFSGMGGLVIGTRAVVLCGVRFSRAVASTVVDQIAEAIALVPFMLFGWLVLLFRKAGTSMVAPAGGGLGALLLVGLVAFLARKRGAVLLRKVTTRILSLWEKDAPQRTASLERELGAVFQRKGRVVGSSCAHLVCWCAGSGNVWIGYHVLGAHPTFLQALAMEGIFSLALAAGFLVPGAFGVQELGYAGIGRLFGLPASVSLALSLIRRARDIVLGAPCLLIWQVAEARHLKRR